MTHVKLMRFDKLNSTNGILDLLASLSCPMPNLLPKSTKMITRTNGKNATSNVTYTVNHKKGGSTFVIITMENLDRFL